MLEIGVNEGRILDFDIEARPLGWYGGDWVHKEPTVIVAAWVDDPEKMFVWTLKPGGEKAHTKSMKKMLTGFKTLYDEASIVVGHYIRGFDLPTLQSAYLEYDLPRLGPKLAHDTKGDLIKFQGLSKSQQNLGGMLGIESPKIGMSMSDWRSANRLAEAGIEYSVERCIGDVRQNIEMREELMRRGALGPPQLWEPAPGHITGYRP